MKLGVLFAGGKDSTYAMYKTLATGNNTIEVLITVISKNPESYMYHVPNIELTRLQAEAMELPIIYKYTEGEKEAELIDLEAGISEAIERYGIEGVVNGAIFSRYQKDRIDKLCEKLNIKNLTPLWHQRPYKLLEEMLDLNFEIIISAVAAYGLDAEWLGRLIDRSALEELATLHNICYVCTGGEGGEYETLVIDAPFYTKKLKILDAERVWFGQYGYYKIKDAILVEKQKIKN